MIHLIVHRKSHGYIRGVVTWLARRIVHANKDYFQFKPDSSASLQPFLSIVDAVEDARTCPGYINLIIGDSFGPFQKRQGQTYVFINFSLLYVLGAQNPSDKATQKWITNKHARMMAKAGNFDLVVDFLPEQTPRLRHDLACHGVPVAALQVSTEYDSGFEPIHQKEWDICVVGSSTPRREVLFAQLEAAGLTLSPRQTMDFAMIVSKSRIVMNVHAYDCATCEYPRLVEAMKSGACLLTEPVIGLSGQIAPDSFISAPYEELPKIATELISNDASRNRLGQRLKVAFKEEYQPRCNASWDDLLKGWLLRFHPRPTLD